MKGNEGGLIKRIQGHGKLTLCEMLHIVTTYLWLLLNPFLNAQSPVEASLGTTIIQNYMWAVITCAASLLALLCWSGKQERKRRKHVRLVLQWCMAQDWWFWKEGLEESSFLFCWLWVYVPVTQNQWCCICVCLCWSLWYLGLSFLVHGLLKEG